MNFLGFYTSVILVTKVIQFFSIRLGNILRVYPSLRAGLLVYILILHIWVAIVLIYYEPEQHGPNFKMPEMTTG